jgi:hypothetical protein
MDQTASIRGPFLREVGASDLIPQMEQGFGYGYR